MLCSDWLRPLANHHHKLLGKLEQSLTQLGAILARGRREQKYSKIQENLKDLRNDTKSFNNIIKGSGIYGQKPVGPGPNGSVVVLSVGGPWIPEKNVALNRVKDLKYYTRTWKNQSLKGNYGGIRTLIHF